MKVTFRELIHPSCPLFSLLNLIIPSDVLLDVLDKDISPSHKDEAKCQPSWTCPHSCPEHPTGGHIWCNRAKMAILHGLIGL